MKKLAVLMILGVFITGAIVLHSCKKEQIQEVKDTQTMMLKAYDFDYPIIMDLNDLAIQVGTANIHFNWASYELCMTLTLDNLGDFYVEEAHYYGDDVNNGIPPYPQSKWDGRWEMGSGDPLGPFCWTIDPTAYPTYFYQVTCDDGSLVDAYSFTWYFALHLQLHNDITLEDETAWMLCFDPATGDQCGYNWWNGGNNHTKGWGQYIPVTFEDQVDCPI